MEPSNKLPPSRLEQTSLPPNNNNTSSQSQDFNNLFTPELIEKIILNPLVKFMEKFEKEEMPLTQTNNPPFQDIEQPSLNLEQQFKLTKLLLNQPSQSSLKAREFMTLQESVFIENLNEEKINKGECFKKWKDFFDKKIPVSALSLSNEHTILMKQKDLLKLKMHDILEDNNSLPIKTFSESFFEELCKQMEILILHQLTHELYDFSEFVKKNLKNFIDEIIQKKIPRNKISSEHYLLLPNIGVIKNGKILWNEKSEGTKAEKLIKAIPVFINKVSNDTKILLKQLSQIKKCKDSSKPSLIFGVLEQLQFYRAFLIRWCKDLSKQANSISLSAEKDNLGANIISEAFNSIFQVIQNGLSVQNTLNPSSKQETISMPKGLEKLNMLSDLTNQANNEWKNFSHKLNMFLNVLEASTDFFKAALQEELSVCLNKQFSPDEMQDDFFWRNYIDAFETSKREKEKVSYPSLQKNKKQSKTKVEKSRKEPSKIEEVPIESSSSSEEEQVVSTNPIEKQELSLPFPLFSLSLGMNFKHVLKKGLREDLQPILTYYPSFLEEVKIHHQQTVIGLNKLKGAMVKKNHESLCTIVPMFILDLSIMLEHLLLPHYFKKNQSFPLGHHLIERVREGGLLDHLDDETRNYLSTLSNGGVWGRYPELASKGKSGFLKTPLDLIRGALNLSFSEELTDRQKNERSLSIIKGCVDLFKIHTHAISTIIPLLLKESKSEQKLLKNLQAGCSSIDNEFEQFYRAENNLDSFKPHIHLTSQINKLDKILDSMKSWLKKQDQSVTLNGHRKSIIRFKEAMGALTRIKFSLTLVSDQESTWHGAWLYRNLMMVQLFFEELYAARGLELGYGEIFSHDLNMFHEVFEDPENAKLSSYNAGRAMHYSQWPSSNIWDKTMVQKLNKYEQALDKEEDFYIEGFTSVDKKKTNIDIINEMSKFIDSALPKIQKHLTLFFEAVS